MLSQGAHALREPTCYAVHSSADRVAGRVRVFSSENARGLQSLSWLYKACRKLDQAAKGVECYAGSLEGCSSCSPPLER